MQIEKSILKNIRDIFPECLKHIFSQTFRNKLLKNKNFISYFNLLENRKNLNLQKIEEYQFTQLKQILIYSFQNVPYYHDLFKKISFDPFKFSDFEQIKVIPFLTREIINENFSNLISKKRIRNGFYTASTGGSTGQPLKFLLDYESIFKENAFVYYYRKKLDYNFEDKIATFRNIEFGNRIWKFNPMQNEIIFSNIKLSKMNIKIYAKKINEYKPRYLNGYLSSIWYFAKLLEEHQIKLEISLKGIFLISENVDIEQRKYIEQFFQVKSSTFYGHSERCTIAEEVAPNKYHFDPYYGYTEHIFIEENKYTIAGTGFLNQIMPLIRYKTDDICIPDNHLFLIHGKRSSNEGVYGINKEFLSQNGLDIYNNPVFKNIISYQFHQVEIGKVQMLIIVNNQFTNCEIPGIQRAINSQTKGIIDIQINVVENLIYTPRGKYQKYICNISD